MPAGRGGRTPQGRRSVQRSGTLHPDAQHQPDLSQRSDSPADSVDDGQAGDRLLQTRDYHYHDLSKWESELEAGGRIFPSLLELGKQFHVQAGFHNHAGEGSIGGALADAWASAEPTGSAGCGLSNHDPGHGKVEGTKYTWKVNLQRISPRLKMVVLKDFLVLGKDGRRLAVSVVPAGAGPGELVRVLQDARGGFPSRAPVDPTSNTSQADRLASSGSTTVSRRPMRHRLRATTSGCGDEKFVMRSVSMHFEQKGAKETKNETDSRIYACSGRVHWIRRRTSRCQYSGFHDGRNSGKPGRRPRKWFSGCKKSRVSAALGCPKYSLLGRLTVNS